MRVLIGYDGSESADAMLDDLWCAGIPRDAEVRVLSVADLLMSAPTVKEAATEAVASGRVATALKRAETHADRVTAEAEGFASTAVETLQEAFPEWKIESRVASGNPAQELVEMAEDWGADRIGVGSQGRSALGRFLLGSVSKSVAVDAKRSVRVARPTVRRKPEAPPRIIIGIDGSPAAEAAVLEVGRRVWPDGTHVHLVAAHDQASSAGIAAILPKAAEMIQAQQSDQAGRADAMVQWASYQLRSIGLVVSISIQKGDAKRILLREAQKWNADLIFVGTREFKNALERFRLGSVSAAVVNNAPCSVEIVRSPNISESAENHASNGSVPASDNLN